MRFYSPLRYPGGKSKLTKHIVELFKINGYNNGTYIEPFAGGSGVALSLLINGNVDSIHINDLDISIYSFWKSAINNSEEFIKLIIEAPLTIKEWEKQKDVQNNIDEASTLELGFSTFFLNRTNISGIIKGGIIGGINQNGNYKMDARFNKEGLINRIRRIAEYKDKITITNFCVKDLINRISIQNNQRYFIYFDPPYYIKGPNLYKNHLTHADHLEISTMIKDIKAHYWMVTYDNVPEIIGMYDDFRKEEYSLNYSAGKATKGKEIMIFSDNLNLNYKEDKIKIVL